LNDDKLTRYFDRLEKVVHRVLRQVHTEIGKKDLGVTGSQYVVLKNLYENGSMTVSEVAEDLGVSLSAVTALVDRLCKSELATRRRDDKDRRLVWLELTSQGEEVVKTCDATRRRVVEKYITKLDEDDLSRLIEIYDKLLQTLENEERGR